MWVLAKSKWWIVGGFVAVPLLATAIYVTLPPNGPPPVTNLKSSQVRRMVAAAWAEHSAIDQLRDPVHDSKNDGPGTIKNMTPEADPQWQAVAAQIQSPILKEIFGLQGDGSLRSRQKAVAQLRKTPLSQSDQNWLYAFLASTSSINGVSRAGQYALKDSIMGLLLTEEGYLPQTAEVLGQIYSDPKQDPTIRDYAIQYLSNTVPQLDDPSQKLGVEKMLETIASDPTSVAQCPAILGLERLTCGANSEVDSTQVAQIALQTASDNSVPAQQRIGPLQVCGQMGVKEAAPVARELAVNGTQAMVRMAALATISQVGDESDLGLLTQASSDPDTRVSTAAAIALQRLRTRLQPN
jgi:hypothetical protein